MLYKHIVTDQDRHYDKHCFSMLMGLGLLIKYIEENEIKYKENNK